MSRNISDFAANRMGVRAGEKYGIEVEAEGLPIEHVPDHHWSAAWRTYWSTTGDGSLRNGGIEFLSKPLGRTAVRHAINALWPYFAERRMVPSVRTGIHIHASCLGLNTDHVRRILQHYALVEPVLFDYVGPDREENIYCIPWYRSPDEARTAYTWLRSWEPRAIDGNEEPCKYSALYIGPLSRFGTIEFRHAPTWTVPEVMFRWWQMVQAVWRTHLTDYDVLGRFNELGPVRFAQSVLNFDWLPPPSERLFDMADVETVCSLIGEPALLTAVDWGRAPELTGPGVATPRVRGAAPPPEDMLLYDDLVRTRIPMPPVRFRNVNINLGPAEEDDPALTVNAAMPADDYGPDNDNTDDEEEEF